MIGIERSRVNEVHEFVSKMFDTFENFSRPMTIDEAINAYTAKIANKDSIERKALEVRINEIEGSTKSAQAHELLKSLETLNVSLDKLMEVVASIATTMHKPMHWDSNDIEVLEYINNNTEYFAKAYPNGYIRLQKLIPQYT